MMLCQRYLTLGGCCLEDTQLCEGAISPRDKLVKVLLYQVITQHVITQTSNILIRNKKKYEKCISTES